MSSEINRQFVAIERLLVPVGVGLTGGSPSIPPLGGALGYDVSTPNNVYLGNSTTWVPIASGASSITNAVVGPISLTGPGLPTLTGTLYLQKIVTSLMSMVYFTLQINQLVTTAVPGVWEAPAATIPAGYIPTTDYEYPMFITVNGSFQTMNSILTMGLDGSIVIGVNFSYVSSTVIFSNYTGNYKI